jgi:hypothetical protein
MLQTPCKNVIVYHKYRRPCLICLVVPCTFIPPLVLCLSLVVLSVEENGNGLSAER